MNNRYRAKKVRVPSDPEKAYGAALKTAFNILGYKDNTVYQLKEKLMERGYSPETVDSVCDYMISKGYLNDIRMIQRSARSLALSKLYGKRRIMRELSLKHFSNEAYQTLNFDGDELCDIDFAEVCLKLLKKKGGARDEKTYAFLMRYGHSSSDIKKAYELLNKENKED